MSRKYSIGVDFGTLSGRALLVDVKSGEEVATAVFEYPHGVIDSVLPDGKTQLGADWALQHPQDYIDVLKEVIPSVIKQANISPGDVIGLGIDFTACTVLPIKNDGTPLCFLEEYKKSPHAYVKLWKHHAAQKEANLVTEKAISEGEKWINRYGGKVSSEWLLPKVWQTLNEAPDIYEKADKFIEAGDWVIMQLTGIECRSACAAGYKGIWHKREGYPSKEFLKSLDPRLENLVEEKLSSDIFPLGGKAGEINEYGARLTGLLPGTAVAVSIIDAHAAAPAVGITKPGKLLIIMGTSSCHIILGEEEVDIPGMCGVVEDGVIGGYFAYESGQACVGDHFDWFVKNCVPAHYLEDAKKQGVNIHKYLREKAKKLKVGESGLLALDWWNGNRSVLVDADLTGMVLGMTLKTKPEEIYRALIEATAFGTKIIIDNYTQNGILVDEIIAAGGIAEKDEMMMQIYSDVTNREIRISASAQAAALGSAMFGAVAAGSKAGGYDDIQSAACAMAKVKDVIYKPIKENVKAYEKLYEEYKILHDYFGKTGNEVMKRLKAIRESAQV
ncbi:MAG: ribulokinase [Eubacteriales bacterium]|jgi:L-ribulokinase|nr:ribulokinase [Eubacteriales bacterium]